MNRENIEKIIDAISKQDHTDYGAASGFTMSSYEHSCGTPACIAGWAAHLSKNKSHMTPYEKALIWMEIDYRTADMLFLGQDKHGSATLSEITPDEAAQTLHNFMITGDVIWSHSASYESDLDGGWN